MLKPDNYKAVDWQWLIDKFESRISHWSNKWLSLGGRLVLIKAVLESQPVYWLALAHIPISVLQTIRKLCFDFLWSGNNHKKKYHLSSWMSIARPKKFGGWGLRNIFLFYRSLATNTLWRALMKQGIWQSVLKDKYFPHVPVWTWLRSVEPAHPFGSQTWKNLCNTLPIILHWLAWKPGSGHSIIVGKDVILGMGQEAFLSQDLVSCLNKKGIHFLYQASRQRMGAATGTRWINSAELDLAEPLAEEWDCYRQSLIESGISLGEKQDELIWIGGDKSGNISVKNIYEALSNSLWNYKAWRMEEKFMEVGVSLKIKLFVWLIAENKILSWKNLQKRGWKGPGICNLCKKDRESTKHLFLNCSFTRSVWEELKKALNLGTGWNGNTVVESFRNWTIQNSI
jgi:hypothetical protein